MNNSQNPAHSVARLIATVLATTSGIAALITLMGDLQLSLMVCGGGIALSIIILLFGSYIVASTHTNEDE